jgi:rhamnan synthesis protein F
MAERSRLIVCVVGRRKLWYAGHGLGVCLELRRGWPRRFAIGGAEDVNDSEQRATGKHAMATLLRLCRFLLQHLWLPYVWLYDLWLFAADLVAIHFRDEFTRLRSECAGAPGDPGNVARVAVVAIHPTDDSILFAQNLLVALTANGFYVLVVYNKPLSAAQRAAIVPHCHHLIERFSLGRDFGAYKRGLIWLEENGKLSNADIVVLANDSMFYPSSFSETVSDMLPLSEDWVTLFENFQFHHHAQSFFLLFRRPVFESAGWRQFWRRYRPYSSRIYCIEKGEKGLTFALVKAGFFPHAVYNAVRVTAALRSLTDAENTRSGGITELLLRLHGGSDTPPQSHDRNRLIEEAILNVGSLMHRRNPTHAAGIIINVSLMAPVKRDICFRGVYDLTEVVSYVRGFTEKELQAMTSDLRRKGFPAGMTGTRKALWAFSRI